MRIALNLAVIIIFFLSAGCNSQPDKDSLKAPTQGWTPRITSTRRIIPSRTPTPTGTATPTFTKTPGQTPTSTRTLIPTETPVPSPTLTDLESKEFVLDLLKTNGRCNLPCWWKIEPGRTPWDEAERFLIYLNFSSYGWKMPGDVIRHDVGGPSYDNGNFTFSFSYYERDGVVQAINIKSDGFYDKAYFRETWQNFSPENVVGKYGTPTRVWVQSFAYFPETPAGTQMGYEIWIFYDNLGFLATYGGLVPFTPTYHMCPTFSGSDQIDDLEFYMQSPANTVPLEVMTRFPSKQEWGFLTFEEATEMSLNDFYKLFTQKEYPVCFNTSRDIWK